jgi:hypothetical protein
MVAKCHQKDEAKILFSKAEIFAVLLNCRVFFWAGVAFFRQGPFTFFKSAQDSCFWYIQHNQGNKI